MTLEGYKNLEKKFWDRYRQKRAETEEKSIAAEHGDRSDSGDYRAAMANLAASDAELSKMSEILNASDPVDTFANFEETNPGAPGYCKGGTIAIFGSAVLIKDLTARTTSWRIIKGPNETTSDNKDVVNYLAPLGDALLGSSKGDMVKYATPGGPRTVYIVDIRYPSRKAESNPYAKYASDINLPHLKARAGQEYHYPWHSPDRKPEVALQTLRDKLAPGWSIVPGWSVSSPSTGAKRQQVFKLFYNGVDTKKYALTPESAVAISHKIDPVTMRRKRN